MEAGPVVFYLTDQGAGFQNVYLEAAGAILESWQGKFEIGGGVKMKPTSTFQFPEVTEAARLARTALLGEHVYQTDGASPGVWVKKSAGWVFAY